MQMSANHEFVADRFKKKPRLTTSYWRQRREVTRKDQGTVTVRQLMDFLDTQGNPRICYVIVQQKMSSVLAQS